LTINDIPSGDWVWMHIRKKRFLAHRRSKLQPRRDGPFKILDESMTVYKVDISCEYGVGVIFNVSNHSIFDVGDDSRSNSFKEERNDMNR